MKKDLTQYYSVVTEKDARKVARLVNKYSPAKNATVEGIKNTIGNGMKYLCHNGINFYLSLINWGGDNEISIKTFSQYALDNERLEALFVEPREIKTLTRELAVKQQALEAINERNNETLDQLEAEKKKTDKLEIAVCMLGFALLVACVILSQKM